MIIVSFNFRYWHRSLNPKKLIEVKFSHLSRNMTMQRHLKLYRLPDTTKTEGLRKLKITDVPEACALLNKVNASNKYIQNEIKTVLSIPIFFMTKLIPFDFSILKNMTWYRYLRRKTSCTGFYLEMKLLTPMLLRNQPLLLCSLKIVTNKPMVQLALLQRKIILWW